MTLTGKPRAHTPSRGTAVTRHPGASLLGRRPCRPTPSRGARSRQGLTGTGESKQNVSQTFDLLPSKLMTISLRISPVLTFAPPDRLPRERAGRGWPAGRRPSSLSQGSEWLRAPFRGTFARSPAGTSTALCACAIGGCSDSRLFRHKARRAGKAHCLRQRRNTGAGQPGVALRVGWCAPRAALRRLPRAQGIACAPRLALNPHQPTAVANGTGAECFGGAFLSLVSLRISKKSARARHTRKTRAT